MYHVAGFLDLDALFAFRDAAHALHRNRELLRRQDQMLPAQLRRFVDFATLWMTAGAPAIVLGALDRLPPQMQLPALLALPAPRSFAHVSMETSRKLISDANPALQSLFAMQRSTTLGIADLTDTLALVKSGHRWPLLKATLERAQIQARPSTDAQWFALGDTLPPEYRPYLLFIVAGLEGLPIGRALGLLERAERTYVLSKRPARDAGRARLLSASRALPSPPLQLLIALADAVGALQSRHMTPGQEVRLAALARRTVVALLEQGHAGVPALISLSRYALWNPNDSHEQERLLDTILAGTRGLATGKRVGLLIAVWEACTPGKTRPPEPWLRRLREAGDALPAAIRPMLGFIVEHEKGHSDSAVLPDSWVQVIETMKAGLDPATRILLYRECIARLGYRQCNLVHCGATMRAIFDDILSIAPTDEVPRTELLVSLIRLTPAPLEQLDALFVKMEPSLRDVEIGQVCDAIAGMSSPPFHLGGQGRALAEIASRPGGYAQWLRLSLRFQLSGYGMVDTHLSQHLALSLATAREADRPAVFGALASQVASLPAAQQALMLHFLQANRILLITPAVEAWSTLVCADVVASDIGMEPLLNSARLWLRAVWGLADMSPGSASALFVARFLRGCGHPSAGPRLNALAAAISPGNKRKSPD